MSGRCYHHPRPMPPEAAECDLCGAPDGFQVRRPRTQPTNWQIFAPGDAPRGGWNRAQVVIVGTDGLCQVCHAEKVACRRRTGPPEQGRK